MRGRDAPSDAILEEGLAQDGPENVNQAPVGRVRGFLAGRFG